MKVLAIGNSFSQDATTYLHDIGKADGVDIKVVNLFIGGCSLERHYNNIKDDACEYDYELNGKYEGRKVSIKEALLEDNWDIVTMQQVSSDSGILDSYYPYIYIVSEYVTRLAPKAKQLIHQTWAYEIDSDHPDFTKYELDQKKMYQSLTNAYKTVADELRIGMIPCGEVIQKLRELPEFDYHNDGISLCRDGYHMDLIYGRYAVAATWYETIIGKNIINNSFLPNINNATISLEKINVIKNVVHKTVKEVL